MVPSDATWWVERFDELGDWRVILHSPYGLKVHGRWRWPSAGGWPNDTESTRSRPPAMTASWCGYPTPTGRRGMEMFVFDAEEIEPGDCRGGRFGAVRLPVRVRPLAPAAAAPASGPAVAAVLASAPAGHASCSGRRRRSTRTSRSCWRRCGNVCGGRHDIARADPADVPDNSAGVRLLEVPGQPNHCSPPRCCSATSGRFHVRGRRPAGERRAAALSLDTALLAELMGRAELQLNCSIPRWWPPPNDGSTSTSPRTATPTTPGCDLLRLLGP